MKPDTLILFTSEFPCGHGEPFLVNEFNVLKEKFKNIIIFPGKYSNTTILNLDSHVTVENIGSYPVQANPKKLFFRNLPLVMYVISRELFYSKKRMIFLKNIREFNSYLVNCIRISEQLNLFLKNRDNSNTVFYSFWMNDWALALSVLRFKNKIKDFVFRANGFDLYDIQTRHNYIPFRPFIFNQVRYMFAVSKKGAEYMRELGIDKDKIKHSYFGTPDYGESPFHAQAVFTVFTCSDLRKIKRVDSMADILMHVDFPVKWIHHGHTGDSASVLANKVKQLPSNIQFILHERKKEYSDVLQFFKENHFNLFVLLSTTEGLPVSLIEAMSFGIPLLATDVGGVSEVVNADNGILIKKDFDPKDIASKIKEFSEGERNTLTFRKKVRSDWEQRFSAKKNYEEFYLNLINYES